MSTENKNILPVKTAKFDEFEFGENGKRYWDITGLKGEFHVDRKHAKVGDLVKDGKKLYKIQKDFSLKRLDKKRKRK